MIASFLFLGLASSAWGVTPDEQTWHALNNSVDGRLYSAFPLAGSCFSIVNGHDVVRDASACSAIEAGYTNASFRVAEFGAYMISEWEGCQSESKQCLLDDTNPTNPDAWTSFNCSQGSIAPRYIDVQAASDVVSAYEFSSRHGVPLVIKNSGHDYKGRSSKKGALGLWVHNLKGITYSSSFTPSGCPDTVRYHAITVGAGVSWQEIYQFADLNNLTAIGGYHQTIAASGGWVMGGGHSVLSPIYGLGVDRVRQFKVVTPDGVYRTVNECENADLFWALRGGGGSTFGVVLESSHAVEPTSILLQVASIKHTGNLTAQGDWLELLVDKALGWGTEGWGGHMTATSLINVTPLLSLEEAHASVAPAVAFALRNGGTAVIETLTWLAFFNKYVLVAEAAVGVPTILGTRLMPTQLFQSADGRTKISSNMIKFLTTAGPYIIQGTPFLYKGSRNATSITPAWYNSLWHLGVSRGSWNYNATLNDKKLIYSTVHNVTQAYRDIAPESGAYFNEGDVYETDHEQAYWGANYQTLLQIKQKYDPHGILDCWQCVGWKGSDSPEYDCYLNVLV
ncbi:isoamyl alcohol oxidase [Punctularia strigosozonata HHB-11173 SS5]|uniref:isoamyl alcohol oxidase n=1 Tax=Punctularia strigosozonata (strain HHB-11173) TaxID=741275 RepID=UPI0004417895|nr:isoamyl alcohol oxidase [Punctularia strigosozonata HHB-11173 SS5]EIN14409.1 isoamyl alcohol oxidase [Punctularia strigosozonata HHB-11173 SS5]